jgi:hypothetical protein
MFENEFYACQWVYFFLGRSARALLVEIKYDVSNPALKNES